MRLTNLLLIASLSATLSTAGIITYTTSLTGPGESPPNASPGIGFATVIFDTTANTMEVNVSFSGLLGTTTASHIHCCTSLPFTGTAIVATQTPSFVNFPLGVTSATYDQVFDLLSDATYNPAFETATGGTAASAEAALLAGAAAGDEYLNIHTSVVPGGEIRGFLASTVPEPGTWLLSLAGIGAVILAKRRLAV